MHECMRRGENTYLGFVNGGGVTGTSNCRVEDPLPYAGIARKLLGYPHRIALQLLGQVGTQRCASRCVQKARVKVLYDACHKCLLFHRPFATAKGVLVLRRRRTPGVALRRRGNDSGRSPYCIIRETRFIRWNDNRGRELVFVLAAACSAGRLLALVILRRVSASIGFSLLNVLVGGFLLAPFQCLVTCQCAFRV